MPNSNFTAITAGGFHSLGLKQDGSLVAWGWNDYGQCDIPSPNSGFIAIAAGTGFSGSYSLGLKEDGSIIAWGENNYGQCNIPEPNSGFTAIAAGDGSSLAIREILPPIEAAMKLTPQRIIRHSRKKLIMAWLRLPEDITKDQIDQNQPLLLYPGGIEPVQRHVFEQGKKGNKRVSIFAFFDKSELMEAIPDNGEVELEVVGSLTTGQEFYGSGFVTILDRQQPRKRWPGR